MKKLLVLALLSAPLMSLTSAPALAEWEMANPLELSGAGALSVGTGVLQVLASPLEVSNATLEGQDALTASGRGIHRAAEGVLMTGLGVVTLFEGGRKGLSDLTVNTLNATGTLLQVTSEVIANSTPSAKVRYQDTNGRSAEKDIPLVVRPEYVQMHEPVDCECPAN